MEKFKLVIFDMDGLMIDSESVYVKSARKALKQFGYKFDMSYIVETIGISWDLAQKIYEKNCPGIDYAAYSKVLDQTERDYLKVHPYKKKKGLMKLLRYLKKNDIAVAVATSTHKKYADKRLNDAGIYDYFDCIVYGDEIKKGKPSPEIYKTVLKKMNVKAKDALVLEDSKNGLLSSSAAGIRCIIVPDICIIPEDIIVKAYDVVEDLGCVIDIIENNK